jgi:hypothetical protein
MPIQTVNSVAIEYPEIPFNVLRFDLSVANGHVHAALHRCRVLPGDVWQDQPGQISQRLLDAPELMAVKPQIDAAATQVLGTNNGYTLMVQSRIESGTLAAAVRLADFSSPRKVVRIADVYTADEPVIQSVMSAIMQAVAAANARLQLL